MLVSVWVPRPIWEAAAASLPSVTRVPSEASIHRHLHSIFYHRSVDRYTTVWRQSWQRISIVHFGVQKLSMFRCPMLCRASKTLAVPHLQTARLVQVKLTRTTLFLLWTTGTRTDISGLRPWIERTNYSSAAIWICRLDFKWD